jgi:hypothetical protein
MSKNDGIGKGAYDADHFIELKEAENDMNAWGVITIL